MFNGIIRKISLAKNDAVKANKGNFQILIIILEKSKPYN